MISDEKKEEVRAAADIVEVVSDYVKLKRSGSGFVGLCPYHNEKSPSFNVNPKYSIFKCFGCGESGDVFKFVMDQDGIGFTEAIRQLGDRYGVFIPEEESSEPSEQMQLKEGVYHALKFAGIFFYRNLIENPEAAPALAYLEKRGFNREVFKRFGLGYSPSSGNELLRAAQSAGIDVQYLVEADLVKPSNRGDGYYDTFRGRLMFPIFSPTGKVIAFAGRVLGNEKTAKYINSAQTKVYNKSEVVYGVNFAKNEIRKNKEVILVEGYTDVITLIEHGIGNVVASSGTALTPGQMRILHRYGEKIIMIYDADNAGQAAMKRGISIALTEGMEVQLLELPDGEDPDSYVKQFGKESFDDLKRKEASDFVDFLILKADEENRLSSPVQLKQVISEILETIASIPDVIQRELYVQHLHQKTQKFRGGTDRELFTELERILSKQKQDSNRYKNYEQNRAEKSQNQSQAPTKTTSTSQKTSNNTSAGKPLATNQIISSGNKNEDNIPFPDFEEFEGLDSQPIDFGQETEVEAKQQSQPRKQNSPQNSRKPKYELDLIRLMITHKGEMIEFIGSLTNEKLFEDAELQVFYKDILKRFLAKEEISPSVYSSAKDPFPRLLGEVMLEQHTVSDRHHEKLGVKYERDKDPYLTAKSTIRTLEINFYKRKLSELSYKVGRSEGEEKQKLMFRQKDVVAKLSRREQTDPDDLYPTPKNKIGKKVNTDVFVYKMKGERDS